MSNLHVERDEERATHIVRELAVELADNKVSFVQYDLCMVKGKAGVGALPVQEQSRWRPFLHSTAVPKIMQSKTKSYKIETFYIDWFISISRSVSVAIYIDIDAFGFVVLSRGIVLSYRKL